MCSLFIPQRVLIMQHFTDRTDTVLVLCETYKYKTTIRCTQVVLAAFQLKTFYRNATCTSLHHLHVLVSSKVAQEKLHVKDNSFCNFIKTAIKCVF